MALYKWMAVDDKGSIHRGKIYARNIEYIESWLSLRHLQSVLVAEERRQPQISSQEKALFFNQLFRLLEAEITIDHALQIFIKSISHKKLKEILMDCLQGIKEGCALSFLFTCYPSIWKEIDIALIHAGETSDNLGKVCRSLAHYYEARDYFTRQLKQAIMMPCITFAFFCVVVAFFFFFLIPRFKPLFIKLEQQHPLPGITQFLLNVSESLHNIWLWTVVALVLFCGITLIYRLNIAWQIFLMRLHLPLISQLIHYNILSKWLEVNAILLKSGIPIIKSLQIASSVIPDNHISTTIIESVNEGIVLSNIMNKDWFFNDPYLIGIIQVGEAAGCLGTSFHNAHIYFLEQLERTRLRLVSFFQPALLLILGALIMFFVIALYAPLFTLSSLVAH